MLCWKRLPPKSVVGLVSDCSFIVQKDSDVPVPSIELALAVCMDSHLHGRKNCLRRPWVDVVAGVLVARFLLRSYRQWMGDRVLFWILARAGQEAERLMIDRSPFRKRGFGNN